MLGRILLSIDGLLLLFGAPLADYNHTHMFNPNWPPHAKFHNGQTITLSVVLGVATMFYTWRPASVTPTSDNSRTSTATTSRRLQREFMGMAAFTGSIYWLAGLAAILYPGTMGLDPEFGGPGFPQAPLFAFAAACALLGAYLTAPPLPVLVEKEKGKGKGE